MSYVRVDAVPHCDEPGCDLGTLQYTCPDCGQHVTDYDSWHDFWAGKAIGDV